MKKIIAYIALVLSIPTLFSAENNHPNTIAKTIGKATLLTASAGSIGVATLAVGKCIVDSATNARLWNMTEFPAHIPHGVHIIANTPPQWALYDEIYTVGTTALILLGCFHVLKATYKEFFPKKHPND
ncbi:MAG: hypothetical protein K2X90_00320 [Candidatus Babeliaceae bacterium]|nr:hypothetical protein [Candidatus Babeliaceae bacterium]